MPKLHSIQGGKGRPEDKPHVCPWCAARFEARVELDQHWLETPTCRRNRSVSNPTQSKYNDAPDEQG